MQPANQPTSSVESFQPPEMGSLPTDVIQQPSSTSETALEQLQTALKDTQLELTQARLSAAQLAGTIFEHACDAMLIADDNYQGISANHEAFRLFGLKPSDLVQTDMLSHLAAKFEIGDRDIWCRQIRQDVLQAGKTQRVVRQRSSQPSNWTEISFSLFTHQDRDYYLIFGCDVTERKNYEDRNRLLASVFENTQEGVIILDLSGQIREANPQFCKFSGLTQQQIEGRNLAELVSWDAEKLQTMIASALAGQPTLDRVHIVNDDHATNSEKDNEKATVYWSSLSASYDKDRAVTKLIAMFSDISLIEETQNKLHRQALHDNLTNLPNRRFFVKQIESLLSSDSPDARFAVCFLDLDDFKVVNDTLGHEAGDELLNQVADRIKSCIYRDCFLSRFGGDEFALLIPLNARSNRVIKIAQAIVEVLNEPFTIGENSVYIGVSIGMTLYPDDADDINTLLRHADVAMYHAKDEGKNTVRSFTPMLAAKIQANQNLLNDLRIAVSENEVTLAYQPKACLKTGNINGCEALIRWSKNDVAVNAGQLIDVAEKSGLILPLGDQIMEKAMRQTKQWRDQGIFAGTMAINLSPRQMTDPDFISRFQALIKKTETQPEWFELEITENSMMDNLDSALKLMEQLKQIGVAIAIDDFGTGYSSLNYLRTFPVSTLKIDLTFVSDIPQDPRAVAVATTILSLGHGLGLQVVAEGVETMEQCNFLKEAGCDTIQGYLINRPLPPHEFTKWIQTQT